MQAHNIERKQAKEDGICEDVENQDNLDIIIWMWSEQLKRHCQTIRVKVGREVPFKPVAKHALKIHVSAAISKRGATNFQAMMDAPLYVSILKGFLVPLIQNIFKERTTDLCRAMIQSTPAN